MGIWTRLTSLFAAPAVAVAASSASAAPLPSLPPEPVSALVVVDQVVGTGAEAKPGQRVEVHYTGWLYNPAVPHGRGKKFDSSKDSGRPFAFPLGAGRVIKGWDQGVAGMRVGGQRMLIIPAALGYGSRGAGGVIPPNATLIFEVELLAAQ
ncbi:MAG: FKBP-type peptidyl-prolyl cis-trans isomerase [Betaproteobacteria bacterium]|jgi:FKBP-type peptidyl-prolyl cis-trans isomerase|nr:FKBP-type peptidyl-prolyl cis-trans isomerase [Betaproteobacteria bacterium]